MALSAKRLSRDENGYSPSDLRCRVSTFFNKAKIIFYEKIMLCCLGTNNILTRSNNSPEHCLIFDNNMNNHF